MADILTVAVQNLSNAIDRANDQTSGAFQEVVEAIAAVEADNDATGNGGGNGGGNTLNNIFSHDTMTGTGISNNVDRAGRRSTPTTPDPAPVAPTPMDLCPNLPNQQKDAITEFYNEVLQSAQTCNPFRRTANGEASSPGLSFCDADFLRDRKARFEQTRNRIAETNCILNTLKIQLALYDSQLKTCASELKKNNLKCKKQNEEKAACECKPTTCSKPTSCSCSKPKAKKRSKKTCYKRPRKVQHDPYSLRACGYTPSMPRLTCARF